MLKVLNAYLNFKPFSNYEAWLIFKIAALAEALGWTMLISGIAISYFITPGNNIAVQIAGHLHGGLFMIYIALALLVAPSLNWRPIRIILAGLASVPPYGSLLFEMWQSHLRQQSRRRSLYYTCLQLKTK